MLDERHAGLLAVTMATNANVVNTKSQIAIKFCYQWHDQNPQGYVV